MAQQTKRGRKAQRNKQELSAAELEDQEVLKPVEPKLTHEQFLRKDKKEQSNLRRLKAVFNGKWKRGQKVPDGWKGDGFRMDSGGPRREVKKVEKKTDTQVDRILKKMKIRG